MKRPRHPMPDDVAQALEDRGLRARYDARPPCQRNGWPGRIATAMRPATRSRRLESMLAELAAGEGTMGMAWRPRGAPAP